MARLSSPALARRLHGAASLLALLGVVALLWPSSLGGRVDYVMVSGTSMQPGMHTGDLAIVRRSDAYRPGDAIAFRIPAGEAGAGSVVIHRVIAGDGDGDGGYTTQGDNRDVPDPWHPTDADVLGRRWALVPAAGTLLSGLRSPLPLALLAAGLTGAVMAAPRPRRPSLDQPPANR